MPSATKNSNGNGAHTEELPILVHVDPRIPGQNQANIHTRWHPEIPCVNTIPLSEPFRVQCLDYSGGQVFNTDDADDVLDLDHDTDHHLSGPFEVPGSRAGDVLEIEILDVRPFDQVPWGYCVTAPGLGSLDADVEGEETKVTKSIWDFYGSETSSRHVPYVSFQGRPHVGVIGTAPSHSVLREWTRRETALHASTSGTAKCDLPLSRGAYVGQDLSPELRQRIYAEGARTSPGREHGGNIDIAQLTKGSRVYLPVYIPGASLSVGDLHFCQSDGEPTTAIEMAGIITLRVQIISDGVKRLKMRSPMYKTSCFSEVNYGDKLYFTGLSVDPLSGGQTDQSGLVSYRNAAFQAISYLQSLGYSREQAYILLSAAPIDTRVTATANRPNFVVSLGIPIGIFHFSILPREVAEMTERMSITGPAVPTPRRVMNGH